MTGMAMGPILWTGLVMLAGTLGAMAARRLELPAACGALAGGLVLSGILSLAGLPFAEPGLVQFLLLAFACFALGAEIDLTSLVRSAPATLVSTALQMAAVTGAVWLAGLLCGFDWWGALLVGVALSATSPTATIAVTSEAGARGDFVQRIITMTSLTLVTSSVLIAILGFPRVLLTTYVLQLAIATVIGFVMLIPLSRIETRGAMTACAACGVLLLVLASAHANFEALSSMAILCGFMAGNLVPNREIVRDTLRGLAFPAFVLLFAGVMTRMDRGALLTGAGAGLLLLAGRLTGLYLAGTMTSGRVAGLRHAAAQIPVSGLSSPGPATLVMFGVVLPGAIPAEPLLVAIIVSEIAGMIGLRWALRRSGEAPLLDRNPDAWRAAMN